jgi:DNA mismatch repair protein MutL
MLMRAVERAYHGLLMDGRHPMVIINISLPAQELDVNVHPTKAEIKFHQEQAIFACLEEAIKATLNKTAIARDKASIAGTESVVPLPTSSWQGIALEGSSPKGQSTGMIREKELPFTAPLPVSGLPVLRVIGQLASTYILAEGPEGLYLIDQHAAHERILYDRIQEQWSRREVEIQGLLQPITIELSPREEETLEESKEILTQFGFAIAPFGDRSYLIRAAPALVKSNLAEAMGVLLDNLATKEGPPWEEKIAQSLACHSAIRAGQQLSDDEMRELIRQLEQAKQPRSCPHGRPTMIHLSLYQLEREFGRRG